MKAYVTFPNLMDDSGSQSAVPTSNITRQLVKKANFRHHQH